MHEHAHIRHRFIFVVYIEMVWHRFQKLAFSGPRAPLLCKQTHALKVFRF